MAHLRIHVAVTEHRRAGYMDTKRGFLTVPEVAAELKIARGRAYELVANGTIPGAVKIGRSVRVSRNELEHWLDKQRYLDVAQQ